jgi:hypothetical protein
MLPELRAFEDDPPVGAPRLVVISAGDADRVREQQIRSPVLLHLEGAAMRAFGAGGTPMGVLVEDGRIASPVVAGADAVLALACAGRPATLGGPETGSDLTARDRLPGAGDEPLA